MKKNWRSNIALYTLFVLILLAVACNQKGNHAEHADEYTCPMHPTVVSDQPGKCPICGMNLVIMAHSTEEVATTEDLEALLKSPNEAIVSSIKTIKGQHKSTPLNIEAQGVITYDTRKLFTISSRISGRLEKVYLKYAYQPIGKGQKVAEIYSPELIAAQKELLFLLESDSENELLIRSAKEKLQLLGATDEQINALITRRKTQDTFTIYSQYDGYIISEAPPTAVRPSETTSGEMISDMTDKSSTTTKSLFTASNGSNEGFIKEGSYVTAGQMLFKVVNTEAIRVELKLPSSAAASVIKGTSVILDYGNGDEQKAIVDFIQPFFSEGQDFLTVRVYTQPHKKLQIGHLVNARITGTSSPGLWIPREAVLDLGNNKIVFLKDKTILKPKTVTLGDKTDNTIEIKQGLLATDEIAANALFLVDNDSFIKTEK